MSYDGTALDSSQDSRRNWFRKSVFSDCAWQWNRRRVNRVERTGRDMGPIHNFAACAKSNRPVTGRDTAPDPRLPPTEADLKIDAEFEAHPDVRALLHELENWYSG